MKCLKWMMVASVCLTMGMVGCGSSQTAQDLESTVVESQYVVQIEPEGAIAVGDARQSVENDQAITLVGLIGGSTEPFVDGIAAFTIVDAKVPYCAPEEGCATPWDYCCTQDQVADNIATVKVVDENGKPVGKDARELLGVKELSTVVVKGKATRDEQGNLSIAASEVFVRTP